MNLQTRKLQTKLFSATINYAGIESVCIIETLPGDTVEQDFKSLMATVFNASQSSYHALSVNNIKRIKALPSNAQPIGKQVARLKNCNWAWVV